jgi:hypothetical protein
MDELRDFYVAVSDVLVRVVDGVMCTIAGALHLKPPCLPEFAGNEFEFLVHVLGQVFLVPLIVVGIGSCTWAMMANDTRVKRE